MAAGPPGPGAPGTPPPPPPPVGGEDTPTSRLTGTGAGPGIPFAGMVSSEFAVFIGTAIAVCIAGLAADDIEPITVWILITVLAFGFIISRGLAKHEHRHTDGADHRH